MKIDKKIIKELVDYLNEFNLTELEYKDGDKKVKVSKNFSNIVQSNITKNQTQKNKPVIGTKINSPIIGTAYLAPEPGGKKFVEIGKKIKKGDTVMIIEAMKTMNHIPSPKDGTVKSIYVEDGQPVEFGQLLVLLE